MIEQNSICLYARVSTDMQASGLDAQLRALRQFCIGRGIEKYQIFADESAPRNH
jgi:DNA invertase Pin-like site-specific DNA recombinase